jgi:hypothetical protein
MGTITKTTHSHLAHLKDKGEYEIYYYILKHSVNMVVMVCMGRFRCVCFRCLENQTVFRSCKYTLSSFYFHEKWHSSARHCYIRTYNPRNREHSLLCHTLQFHNVCFYTLLSGDAVTTKQSHTQLCIYYRNSPSQNRATCFDSAAIIRHIITKTCKAT